MPNHACLHKSNTQRSRGCCQFLRLDICRHRDDEPRSLNCCEVRRRRMEQLSEPHVKRLTEYVDRLRAERPGQQRNLPYEVPYFDPLDGGTDASMLLLGEKPGPDVSRDGLPGFISRNNNDLTAQNVCELMRKTTIPRNQIVVWNVVPWWNGANTATADEVREGVRLIEDLRGTGLMPNLRAVVFMGRKAQTARTFFSGTDLILRDSMHPSPRNRASRPKDWERIAEVWEEAWKATMKR